MHRQASAAGEKLLERNHLDTTHTWISFGIITACLNLVLGGRRSASTTIERREDMLGNERRDTFASADYCDCSDRATVV
jgi:hypothetical protein